MSLVNETWSRDVPPQNFPLAGKMRVAVKGWVGGGEWRVCKKAMKKCDEFNKISTLT